MDQKLQKMEENSRRFGSIMHGVGFLTLACSLLSIYLIVFKSGRPMRIYKHFLLAISVCCGVFDVYMCLLYTPNVLLPVFGVCLGGLWEEKMREQWISVICFILVVVLMLAVSFSTTLAFLYRLATIAQRESQFMRAKTFALFFLVYLGFVGPAASMFAYAMLYDPEATRLSVQESYLTIYTFSLGRACTFMSAKVTPKAVLFGILAVMLANLTSMITNLTLVFLILYRLRFHRDLFSCRTLRMHRQLTISLGFQFAIPTLFVVIPTSFVDYQLLSGSEMEESVSLWLSQLLIQAMGLHSVLNFLVMVCMIGPYRRAVTRLLLCWSTKNRFSGVSVSELSNVPEAPPAVASRRESRQRSIVAMRQGNVQGNIERDQDGGKMFVQRISVSEVGLRQSV